MKQQSQIYLTGKRLSITDKHDKYREEGKRAGRVAILVGRHLLQEVVICHNHVSKVAISRARLLLLLGVAVEGEAGCTGAGVVPIFLNITDLGTFTKPEVKGRKVS